jgi:hypothetical protein
MQSNRIGPDPTNDAQHPPPILLKPICRQTWLRKGPGAWASRASAARAREEATRGGAHPQARKEHGGCVGYANRPPCYSSFAPRLPCIPVPLKLHPKHEPEKLQTFWIRSCDRTNSWSENRDSVGTDFACLPRVATRSERVIGPLTVIDQNQRRLSGLPRVW